MSRRSEGKREALKIFSGLSASYDNTLYYFTLAQDQRWKDWVAGRVRLKGGSKLLDLGCGTCLLEERIRKDCFVVGLDLSEGMLRVAQAKRPHATGSLLLSDGERLPFKDAAFDAVASCYAIKYCEPGAVAAEAARVLRPGGRLVLYDFVRPRGPLWPLSAIYVYGVLPFLGKALWMKGDGSAYTFEALPKIIAASKWEETLGRELSKNGFSAVERTLLSGGAAIGFAATKGA